MIDLKMKGIKIRKKKKKKSLTFERGWGGGKREQHQKEYLLKIKKKNHEFFKQMNSSGKKNEFNSKNKSFRNISDKFIQARSLLFNIKKKEKDILRGKI